MILPFTLPPLDNGVIPFWKDNAFHVQNNVIPVLEYSSSMSGWSDKLTFFHENHAGDQHYIDKASHQNAINELKAHLKTDSPVVLEVGCSSGFMLKKLQAGFPTAVLLGSDAVKKSLLTLSKTLPVPLFQFDLLRCPLPADCLDAVVILNVLEHIEDDSAALKQLYRILKPGGILMIEVPAEPDLYDIYDKMLMHFRRYTHKVNH